MADSDPPHTAEVDVNSRARKRKRVFLPRRVKKSSRQADCGNLKAGHCRDINVKTSEDKRSVCVTGVLTVGSKVVVVDNGNEMLKLFNDSGGYLSSTALKDYTWGITRVGNDKLATCGYGNTVYLWNIQGKTITCSDVTYRVGYHSHGIRYDGTYYCVLHMYDDTIAILDRQGKQVRHIKAEKAFGKQIRYGMDISMDEHSHDIYVPYRGDNDSGVFCMSVHGEPLWFTPVSSVLCGITEIRGVLCVADTNIDCLHLLSKAGKYKGKLMEEKDVDGKPLYMYYDSEEVKLYVSYDSHTDKRDVISVYSVMC